MKRIITVLLVALIACTAMFSVYAEDVQANTQFEQVLLKKGSLFKKQFIDIATITDDSDFAKSFPNSIYGKLTSQAAILTDMTNGEKFYALRLTLGYYASKYDGGEETAVLDLAEIDSVISALKSMKVEFTGNLVDYTEFVYTSNSGVMVAGYYSAKETKLMVKLSSAAIAIYEVSRIDELINFFENAKVNIEGLI